MRHSNPLGLLLLTASSLLIAAPPLSAATGLVGNGVVLEVADSAPVGITSVRRTPSGPSLFLSPDTVEPTWELVCLTPDGQRLTVDPVSVRLGGQVSMAGREMSIRWDRVEVPGGTMGVRCTWTADARQPVVYGRIEVDNASPCRLREVQFPRLTLRPTPSPATAITLVFPRAYGRSWRDPFHAPRGYLVGTMEPAGFTGSAEMQFGTLYDDAGNGLYWASHDPLGYHKRFVYDNTRAGSIHLKLAYVPENANEPGLDFTSPYPVVLGAYRGDWWEAAHLYRTWALQQTWCRLGPLETRTEVPDWVKQTEVWARGDSSRLNPRQSQRYYEHLLKTFGGPIGVQWYSWVHPKNWSDPLRWPPVAGTPELCATCKAEGIHLMPYVNSLQWDTATPTFPEGADTWALRGEDGRPRREANTGSTRPVDMCAAAPVWQETLVRACARLIEDCHAAGVYYDELGGQCGRPCWSPAHGHPAGGGPYATEALRRLCRRTRTAMRKVDAQAALSGEGQNEFFLDVTDLRLTHYNIWPGWIPLWAAVYGDMTATFGRTIVWTGPRGEGANFYARCGNTFVSGIQFARLWPTPAEKNWITASRFAEQFRYFRRLVALRRTAHAYLEFGWLQRPVRLRTNVPVVPLLDAKGRDMTVPVVLHSAWASHAGTLAFVFTNIGDRLQQVEWQADLSRYEIARSRAYVLYRLEPDRRREPVGTLRGTLLTRTDSLPPHSAFILEAEPASP